MALSLKDLLISIANDAVAAQQSVKVESTAFFEALFEKTDEGYKPREFVLDFLKHDVALPFVNMTDQDHFPIKKMKLALETEASLTTGEDGAVYVDCTLKNGLQKTNSKLSIELELEAKDSTEGIEQVRAYLAERLADQLLLAKQERKETE